MQWKPLFTLGIKCTVHLWKPKNQCREGCTFLTGISEITLTHVWWMYHKTVWHFESKNAFIKPMYYVTQHNISNLDVLSLAASLRFCISASGKINFFTSLLVSNRFASTYCMTDNLLLYKWSGYYITWFITTSQCDLQMRG